MNRMKDKKKSKIKIAEQKKNGLLLGICVFA